MAIGARTDKLNSSGLQSSGQKLAPVSLDKIEMKAGTERGMAGCTPG
jgi:hypothetical protein